MTEKLNTGLNVSLSKLVVLFCACFVFATMDMWRTWHYNEGNFEWDNLNYYSYLPAAFCNKGSFEFKHEAVKYLEVLPNGQHISSKTYGVSLLQLPFFCLGNIYCSLVNKVHNGFVSPYCKSIHWGGIIYGILGLIFLRRFLLEYFSETVTALTLLICFLGTNLFYYTAGASEMDHVYLFFLLTLFLNANVEWHRGPTVKLSVFTGLLLGLLSLIRETETLTILFFLFWNVSDKISFKNQLIKFRENKKMLMIVFGCFIFIWIPQLVIWKSLTGFFFYRAGNNEHYFWTDPQIINILFSYRKGWLLYSPMVILAFIGFFFMKDELKRSRWILISVLVLAIYILSCWWNWFFGGGFSGRAFSQDMAWLSIPIASLCAWMFEKWNKKMLYRALAFAFFIAVFSGISLNIGQTYQYVQGYIHYDSSSKTSYHYVFGKFSLSGEESHKLWGMLNYLDNEKMKSGEQRDQ
jgi:hypothetical protein